MATRGQWIGLKEANAAMRRLPEHARKSTQPEINATASRIAALVRDKAPVSADGSHGRPAGFLKASITWDARKDSAVVSVNPDAFYWKYLEYGTVKIHARPFVRPAVESVSGDATARVIDALDAAAEQMAKEA